MAIPKGTKANFQVLQQAVEQGGVALMEVTDKKTGELVDAICAVNVEKDGTHSFVPLAFMVRENPYDRFIPPT